MPATVHHSAYDYGSTIGSVWDSPENQPMRTYGRLEGSETCDVVVIGAGLTGLAAAYRLASEYKAQVIVIDAGGPGWGSSGRSLGLCGPAPLAVYNRLNPQSGTLSKAAFLQADLAAMSAVETLAGVCNTPMQKSSDGILATSLHDGTADLRSGWQALLHSGSPPPFQFADINKTDLHAHWLNSARLGGALHIKPAFGINPLHLCYGLAAACEAIGVRVYGGTRVREVLEKRNWIGVRYRGGTLSASHAIIATNAFSRGHAMPELANRMFHILFQSIATRPLTDDELASHNISQPLIMRIENEITGPLHMRVLPDRRVMLSTSVTLDADPARSADVRLRMRRKFLELLPGLRDVQITHSWRGLGGRTIAGLPCVVPMSEQSRLVFAGALDFDSVGLATLLGSTAASVVAAQDGSAQLPFVSSEPMPKIRFAGWKMARLAKKVSRASLA